MSFDVILPFFPKEFQALFSEPGVTDIMITNRGLVFVDRNGKLEEQPITIDQRGLEMAIKNIAHSYGTHISNRSPMLEVKLPDGSRVAALCSPNSLDGWSLTIRRYYRWFSLAELVECGTLTQEQCYTLSRAVQMGRNILASGGTSSGKTTLINALIGAIPAHQRLIVIEKPAEMRIDSHRCVQRWEATNPGVDRPEITMGMLVSHALRHRPDRLIVGEVKDPAAFFMLQAMNTGHPGLTTVHANNPALALDKVSGLALGAYPNLNHQFVRQQTAEAIDLVAHMARDIDGLPRVVALETVVSYDLHTQEFVTAPAAAAPMFVSKQILLLQGTNA